MLPDRRGDQPLKMVRSVTRRHANRFVAELIKELTTGADMLHFVDEARIMTWPDDEDEAGQERHDAIAGEILRRTLEESAAAIGEAFVRVAAEVLERERRRQ